MLNINENFLLKSRAIEGHALHLPSDEVEGLSPYLSEIPLAAEERRVSG